MSANLRKISVRYTNALMFLNIKRKATTTPLMSIVMAFKLVFRNLQVAKLQYKKV